MAHSLSATSARQRRPLLLPFLVICLVAVGCTATSASPDLAITPSTNASVSAGASPKSEGADDPTDGDGNPQLHSPSPTTPRPEWLGLRTIPTTDEGYGVAVETPVELAERRFATVDTLLPPPANDVFNPTWVTLDQVPDVLARSTWEQGCPVPPEKLAYITVPFWGFDGWVHTGELIVHDDVAADVIGVFEELYGARFPIEEMRVITRADVDAPPIGDGNNSGSFVCRPVTGGTSFSEHAKGLAIDINPFHNPYIRGDRVLPEQASTYIDRSLNEQGMLQPDSLVVQAFAEIGWSWGGSWNSLKDYQHFSANGR